MSAGDIAKYSLDPSEIFAGALKRNDSVFKVSCFGIADDCVDFSHLQCHAALQCRCKVFVTYLVKRW